MMKSLDLRLQLRKDAVALQAMVGQLPGLMDRGNSSRMAVLAASGLGRSGNEQIYLESWQRDSVAAEELQNWARSRGAGHPPPATYPQTIGDNCDRHRDGQGTQYLIDSVMRLRRVLP